MIFSKVFSSTKYFVYSFKFHYFPGSTHKTSAWVQVLILFFHCFTPPVVLAPVRMATDHVQWTDAGGWRACSCWGSCMHSACESWCRILECKKLFMAYWNGNVILLKSYAPAGLQVLIEQPRCIQRIFYQKCHFFHFSSLKMHNIVEPTRNTTPWYRYYHVKTTSRRRVDVLMTLLSSHIPAGLYKTYKNAMEPLWSDLTSGPHEKVQIIISVQTCIHIYENE